MSHYSVSISRKTEQLGEKMQHNNNVKPRTLTYIIIIISSKSLEHVVQLSHHKKKNSPNETKRNMELGRA